jgi:hypothetical protein
MVFDAEGGPEHSGLQCISIYLGISRSPCDRPDALTCLFCIRPHALEIIFDVVRYELFYAGAHSARGRIHKGEHALFNASLTSPPPQQTIEVSSAHTLFRDSREATLNRFEDHASYFCR